MTQEELIRFKIKNTEFKAKIKSENEKFSYHNIIKIKNLNELNLAIEKSLFENKTPLIIRETRYSNMNDYRNIF